jgi:hypothetical protein
VTLIALVVSLLTLILLDVASVVELLGPRVGRRSETAAMEDALMLVAGRYSP